MKVNSGHGTRTREGQFVTPLHNAQYAHWSISTYENRGGHVSTQNETTISAMPGGGFLKEKTCDGYASWQFSLDSSTVHSAYLESTLSLVRELTSSKSPSIKFRTWLLL